MIEENQNTNLDPNRLDIVDELKQSYIDYAMSVIVSRALPDVRDGLKPVQRRILYAMHKMNIAPNTQHKKVARIVGDVIGKYHPHGDASVTDALVRMGQDFNLRYPLIDGQGNFGSIDGDPAAAMRYIEARMSKLGFEMLQGVENTADFVPNYDGHEVEPKVLPTAIPNILLNGAEGIAVGMATKIPPHNLREVVAAISAAIDLGTANLDENVQEVNYETEIRSTGDLAKLVDSRFPKFKSLINTGELMQHIKGPDFPTGGEIYNAEDIKQVFETGRGSILMRGVTNIEEGTNGRFKIIITEIPYQVNKANLVSKIAMLVREKKIEGISDLRDESNREGIRVVVEVKRDANAKTVENKLYKFTELQKNFSSNIILLHNNHPRVMGIKNIIEYFVTFRVQIVIREKEYELAKAREREHILEGLIKALNNIDEVIETIKKSKDSEDAKNKLCEKFDLTEIQAQAILDMQLRRLAALERDKLENEYKEILAKIAELINILSNIPSILEIIKNEQKLLSDKYGDDRRTKVFKHSPGEITIEDTTPNEPTLVMLSEKGYIKRIKQETNRIQSRGGTGKRVATTKEDDSIRHILPCNTHDEILFFSNTGKVYALKAYEIPESSANAKGLPIINLIGLNSGELITSILTRNEKGELSEQDMNQEGENKTPNKFRFLLMATKKGTVKKTKIEEFTNIRSNGLIAIKLIEEDELIWVRPTNGEQSVLLISKFAKCIHFTEEDIRETGRSSQGVRGIRLKSGDEVISMDIVRPAENLVLTLSENGFGKVTEIDNYSIQKRGGSGVFAAKINSKTGNLVIGRILDHPQKELMIVSKNGQGIKVETNNLPLRGRQTSGVIMIRLKDDDKVAAVAIV